MLSAFPLLVVAPIAGLLVYCVSHVLGARMLGRQRLYVPLFAGIGVGLLVTIVLTGVALIRLEATMADAAAYLLMGILEYLALAFGYFNFVNLVLVSLRIRLLQELERAGGQLSHAALLACYNTDAAAAMRLDRLVQWGNLICVGDRYESGPSRGLLYMDKVFDALRWLILGPRHRAALRVHKPKEIS